MGMSSHEWSLYLHEVVGLREWPEVINRGGRGSGCSPATRWSFRSCRARSRPLSLPRVRRLPTRGRVVVEPRADRRGALDGLGPGRRTSASRCRRRRSGRESRPRTSTSRPRNASASIRPVASQWRTPRAASARRRQPGCVVIAYPNRHYPPATDALVSRRTRAPSWTSTKLNANRRANIARCRWAHHSPSPSGRKIKGRGRRLRFVRGLYNDPKVMTIERTLLPDAGRRLGAASTGGWRSMFPALQGASPGTGIRETLRLVGARRAARDRGDADRDRGARLDGAERVERARRLGRRPGWRARHRLRGSNLHVVNYSAPIAPTVSLEELRDALLHASRPPRSRPVPDVVLRGELGVLPQPAAARRLPTANTRWSSTRRSSPGPSPTARPCSPGDRPRRSC